MPEPIDDDLVGLWDSAAFDDGAMENSKLALLADGTGWGEWSNVGGGMEVVFLRWQRPRNGVLEITELELFSGTWEPSRPGRIVGADPPTLLDDTTQYGYELVESPARALKLDEPFLFTSDYGFDRPTITPADRPTPT